MDYDDTDGAILSTIAALRHLHGEVEDDCERQPTNQGLAELVDLVNVACDAMDKAADHCGINLEDFDFSDPENPRKWVPVDTGRYQSLKVAQRQAREQSRQMREPVAIWNVIPEGAAGGWYELADWHVAARKRPGQRWFRVTEVDANEA